jgi:hypothetical protein
MDGLLHLNLYGFRGGGKQPMNQAESRRRTNQGHLFQPIFDLWSCHLLPCPAGVEGDAN